MPSLLNALNTANEVAYLAGLFNWEMVDSKFTNADGTTVSFSVISKSPIPLAQFIQGEINTFELLTNGAFSKDPNKFLFNTFLTTKELRENLNVKYAINRIPYANYDQLVPLGTGGQRLSFDIVICGTMYLTGFSNIMQVLYTNTKGGLGVLQHPFYGTIKNVMPLEPTMAYRANSLNCIVMTLNFQTSDATHLAKNLPVSILATISKWFIGTENALSSIQATIGGAKALNTFFRNRI